MKQVRIALSMMLIMTLLLGVVYPLMMTGIAQLAFSNNPEATKTIVRREYRDGFGPPQVG